MDGVLLALGLLLIVGAFVASVMNRVAAAPGTRGGPTPPRFPAALLGLLGVVALAVGVASSAFQSVPAGFVGVVRQFGAVTGATLSPGLHFVVPVVNNVELVDTKVRAIRIEDYPAASKEQQDLFLDMTLNYAVRPGDAPRIVQELGLTFEDTIVRPRFLDIPKSVTDDYPTTTVLNSRDEIRQRATELLRQELEPRGFVVVGINLENFSYSSAYNQAIEDKQVAQQQVETERQKLEQQRIIAQQKVETAKGDAEAQIERARGESESNRIVAASLTEEILLNRYIEKLADNVSLVLVPSDSGGLILDLNSLRPQASAQP